MTNTLRIKSIKDLGKGAWKISDSDLPDTRAPKKKNNALYVDSESRFLQNLLWEAVSRRWPELSVQEFENAVPGRRFRIDIAVPSVKLAIEVDGWQYHGKFKADFIKDRARQNLMVINGWRILRFTAGQILKERDVCIDQIELAIAAGQLPPTVSC